MIVVADTSPLNYFLRLGRVNLLHVIYGRVLVPTAVLEELRHPSAPPEVRLWASQPPEWLETVEASQLDPTFLPKLGAGEREAISLALLMQADILLIDEFLGRQEAEALHIAVAGTLAVLLRASLLGHLDFPSVLQDLRQLGFRVSRTVENDLLALYEQTKRRL